MLRDEPRITETFQRGGGMRWDEHDPNLFIGIERFFRPGYTAHIVREWIPVLSAVEAKLMAGGTVADVGCGHGASASIMAKTYPRSRFHSFDTPAPQTPFNYIFEARR